MDKEFHLTDTGNAERFQSVFGDTVKYLTEKGRFIQWDKDNGWTEQDGFILAKEIIRDLHREAAECKDESKRGQLAKFALDAESISFQRNFLSLLEHYAKLSISEFDANHTVVNCTNGVVNLKDKAFYIHSPEYFHLNKTNASYKLDATCQRWTRFLDEIFEGDRELIDWIQVALGYSMLGLTREHCFFLCHGAGSNGKGVLLETIQYVLGSYAHKTNFKTFLQTDKSSNARELEAVGDLKGKRFVLASEANDKTRFDAARIKELTGGDTLSGGALYKSKFEFTPTHTLWFACNHLPEIKDNTFSIWRRVKTIPFNRIFHEKDRQANLPEVLRGEADGILAWLVDGAYRYLQSGLPETPAVCKQATREYREINDKLPMFIREYLIEEKNAVTAVDTVYKCYKEWQIGTDTELIAENQFGKEIISRGTIDITKKRQSKGNIFIGCKLRIPEQNVGNVGENLTFPINPIDQKGAVTYTTYTGDARPVAKSEGEWRNIKEDESGKYAISLKPMSSFKDFEQELY